ncbi:hypothetical protein PMAYCL1PPCAC_20955, partial [Pristionchus mayeri]
MIQKIEGLTLAQYGRQDEEGCELGITRSASAIISSVVTVASSSAAISTSTTVSAATVATASSSSSASASASVRELDARVHTADSRSVHGLHCILCISLVFVLDEGEAGRATRHPHLEDLPVATEGVLDLLRRGVRGQTSDVDLSSVGHDYCNLLI